jgi:hypothetical protein
MLHWWYMPLNAAAKAYFMIHGLCCLEHLAGDVIGMGGRLCETFRKLDASFA